MPPSHLRQQLPSRSSIPHTLVRKIDSAIRHQPQMLRRFRIEASQSLTNQIVTRNFFACGTAPAQFYIAIAVAHFIRWNVRPKSPNSEPVRWRQLSVSHRSLNYQASESIDTSGMPTKLFSFSADARATT
jgi:hypothetical protein